MGLRGPAPTPTAIKRLRGTARSTSREPTPALIEAPRVPYGLLGPDGQRLWRDLAPKLSENGLLSELDVASLLMLCAHFDAACAAARAIRDRGVLATDERGLERKTPASQVLRDHSKSFQGYADRFGLSPSARTRLVVTAVEDLPDLAEVLFGLAGGIDDEG